MTFANAALRKGILAAAGSPRLQRFVSAHGMRFGARRFVGGATLDEVVETLRALNAQGLAANTTLLGEDVRNTAAAAAIAGRYEEILQRLADERLDANVALKLTQLGLAADPEAAYRNVARLVRHAAGVGNFVRIDMEESRHVEPTLDVYRRLRAGGQSNVGVVLQSYLYRSEADLASLLPLEPNVRLVKGAYLEAASVAYPQKRDVDAAFVRLAERALAEGGYTAIATHDERLIDHVIEFCRRKAISGGRFEFQMLYGVRPRLQLDLVRRGHRVRVATPYGSEWYPYLMRRLAERPANVLFFVRSLVQR
ncbi:MAG: proline dehydrogenase family protein [Gaiellaceae bacterium]